MISVASRSCPRATVASRAVQPRCVVVRVRGYASHIGEVAGKLLVRYRATELILGRAVFWQSCAWRGRVVPESGVGIGVCERAVSESARIAGCR